MKSELLMVIKDLSVHYPKRSAIHHLSLELKENDAYTILGPSGCGKTTLLYAIAELLPKAATIEGTRLATRPLKKSLVLQDYGLFPWKTVLENVLLPLKLEGKKSSQSRESAMHLLKHLGLEGHLEDYPPTLSGGQKQRVALARSWAMNPDLLLMDEPFSALDAMTRERLQEDVLNFYKSTSLTMVTVTHSIEEAVFLGRHVIVMNTEGSLVKMITNKSFGMEDARESDLFFEQCIELRKMLKEVSK